MSLAGNEVIVAGEAAGESAGTELVGGDSAGTSAGEEIKGGDAAGDDQIIDTQCDEEPLPILPGVIAASLASLVEMSTSVSSWTTQDLSVAASMDKL